MTLDDAHVFVAPDQVGSEVARILGLIRQAYGVLGIDHHRLRLSLCGPEGSYVDAPAMWDRAQEALRAVLAADAVEWDEARDEAAFYGPKIDVQVHDARSRELTLSTVQVDFHLPAVFDLAYRSADGGRERPVVIHHSLISTMERLVAHLIEWYEGRFPVWLAPVQLAVLPVDADHHEAAHALARAARDAGVRAEVGEARHSLGSRVRHAHERGVPFSGVVGDRELADGTVALRGRDGDRLPPMPVANAVDHIATLAALPTLH